MIFSGAVGNVLRCSLLVPVVFTQVACGGSTPEQQQTHLTRSTQGGQHVVHRRDPGVRETRPIHWRVVSPPSGRIIRLFSVAEWCVGTPTPKITKTQVRQRPRAVVITAFMTRYHHPAKNEVCPALEVGLKKTVTLSEDLGSRAVYDGSTSPLEKRWPKP